MLFTLLLLFIALPMVELWLLLQLGASIGWGWTLLIAVGTGMLGAALARQQGLATLARISEQLRSGAPPADTLVDGAMILVAGAVLITPGVLTDAVGFALLAPPIRALLKPLLRATFRRWMKRATERGEAYVWTTRSPGSPASTAREGSVIDVEATEVRSRDADR